MNRMLEFGLMEYGVHEFAGERHNPDVMKYFHEAGHDWVRGDETAWCSAFVDWCAMKANYERARSLRARSWLEVGRSTNRPVVGDVVVFWRIHRASPYGHVGMYIAKRDGYIYVLGGNQSNKVCVSAYHQSRLLGYRTLKILQ